MFSSFYTNRLFLAQNGFENEKNFLGIGKIVLLNTREIPMFEWKTSSILVSESF